MHVLRELLNFSLLSVLFFQSCQSQNVYPVDSDNDVVETFFSDHNINWDGPGNSNKFRGCYKQGENNYPGDTAEATFSKIAYVVGQKVFKGYAFVDCDEE